jgi:hypothetical protein
VVRDWHQHARTQHKLVCLLSSHLGLAAGVTFMSINELVF